MSKRGAVIDGEMNKRAPDPEDLLSKLTTLLKEREKALDEREQELDKERAMFETEFPGRGTGSDVLGLNVGGTPTDVLRRTLTQIDGSMLASRFSGRWDDNLEKDPTGRFFVDQPYDLFLPLLNYLRARAIETPRSLPLASPHFDDALSMRNFHRMLDYYGVTFDVYPVAVFKMNISSKLDQVAGHPDYKVTRTVSSDDIAASYCILPKEGNHLSIQSFEIALEEGNHAIDAKVGWLSHETVNSFFNSEEGKQHGVGYVSTSLAFDCGRIVMQSHKNATPIPGLTLKAGTVICCEKQGENWYVNGKLVASTQVKISGVTTVSSFGIYNPVPCITTKGCFTVTRIDFKI
jgi:BTB/POZ domain